MPLNMRGCLAKVGQQRWQSSVVEKSLNPAAASGCELKSLIRQSDAHQFLGVPQSFSYQGVQRGAFGTFGAADEVWEHGNVQDFLVYDRSQKANILVYDKDPKHRRLPGHCVD